MAAINHDGWCIECMRHSKKTHTVSVIQRWRMWQSWFMINILYGGVFFFSVCECWQQNADAHSTFRAIDPNRWLFHYISFSNSSIRRSNKYIKYVKMQNANTFHSCGSVCGIGILATENIFFFVCVLCVWLSTSYSNFAWPHGVNGWDK